MTLGFMHSAIFGQSEFKKKRFIWLIFVRKVRVICVNAGPSLLVRTYIPYVCVYTGVHLYVYTQCVLHIYPLSVDGKG